MRNLINLIVKNIHWLLFILLLFVSGYLIISNNNFQRSKYLTVEQELVGSVYSVSNRITSYVGLKSANDQLIRRLAELEVRNEYLENYIKDLSDPSEFSSIQEDFDTLSPRLVYARVINNSISGSENLITLNKGSNDGIEPDMGVFSPEGVVGIIMSASPHFSVVVPILNSKSNLSCKVRRSNYPGSLKWDGEDSQYAYLEELPRHVIYALGDTIVTSGFSSVFPEGIRVGTVVDSKKQRDDNYVSLKLKLFTNFSALSDVLVVKKTLQEEREGLEDEARDRILKGERYDGN